MRTICKLLLAVLALSATVALNGCSDGVTEKQLIGTWQAVKISADGREITNDSQKTSTEATNDQTAECGFFPKIELKPNGSYTSTIGSTSTKGTWQLRGGTLTLGDVALAVKMGDDSAMTLEDYSIKMTFKRAE